MSVVTEEMAAIAEQARQMKRAEYFSTGLPPSGSLEDACMFAALAAVAPRIAAQERERCIAITQSEHGDAAQDIDMATRGCDETGRLQSEGAAHAAARITAAIRALGDAT